VHGIGRLSNIAEVDLQRESDQIQLLHWIGAGDKIQCAPTFIALSGEGAMNQKNCPAHCPAGHFRHERRVTTIRSLPPPS
jgi:hypothetical protein